MHALSGGSWRSTILVLMLNLTAISLDIVSTRIYLYTNSLSLGGMLNDG